ncbi:MAG: cysteine hydrolase family protein [Candidatus Woesearchaeota archaeon]
MATAIFWNVDTQFDFMRKEGKLYVPDAEKIEPMLARITRLAKEYGIKVVSTADSHDKSSHELAENPDFITTFPEHCIYGTPGAEYVPATKPENAYVLDWRNKTLNERLVLAKRNIVLTKDDFDVFNKQHGSPHVEQVLELLKPKKAVVYGVATNVCVDYAVEGLLNRGIEVYVLGDAIKGLPGIPDPVEKWQHRDARIIGTDNLETMLR